MLHEKLLSWNSSPSQLQALTHRFQSLQNSFSKYPELSQKIGTIFEELSQIESELTAILTPTSALEEETYKELLFLKPYTQTFNFVPYFLPVWSIFRVYILPGLSMLIPFFALVLPYLIIRFVFKLPMNFERYFGLLHSIISGKVPSLHPQDSGTSSATPQSRIKILSQSAWILATIVQSVLQPYWSYRHLKSVDTILKTKEQTLARFKELYTRLQTTLANHNIDFFRNPIPSTYTGREAVANILLHAPLYKQALRYIGGFEALYRLTSKESVLPVSWQFEETLPPRLEVIDTYDYNVPKERRVPFTVALHKKQHALLTGPNKGGKSTVLRSILMNVVLAHTYGCFIGRECHMTPFERIYVCLKPDDLPGTLSRFEREVEFTSKTLFGEKSGSGGNTLILIDELYHSTNPPDALTSCRSYCSQLWKRNNYMSIISTHLFELVEEADSKRVERLCCPATMTDAGDIIYSYSLQKGICRVSSVGELLKKYGMDICARLTQA